MNNSNSFPAALGRLLTVVLIAALAAACGAGSNDTSGVSAPEPSHEDRPTMRFEIDEELLGAQSEFAEAGFRFRPPYGWYVLGGQQAQSMTTAMEPLLDPEFAYSMLELYYEDNTNTLLLVAVPDLSAETANGSLESRHRLESQAEYYRTHFDIRELRMDQFRFGEYELDQLILVEQSVVVLRYRLMHQEHPEVELVFAVPSENFAQMIPLIESVVGSATPM